MDFKLVVVVLLTYFIRPQDWVPGMAGINLMKPLMAVTILAMFTRRRGVTAHSFFKTPTDWAVVAYGIYIIASAPDGQSPFGAVVVLVAYYFVTAQALSTPRRISIYLTCWLICLVVVAAMAVASEYGLDLTGAREITYAVPENPRLALNTYLFDNPNSLGHSVVLAIPLAYFLLFWRKPASKKLLAIAIVVLTAYCAYLTKSKGAYLVGFAVLVASQLFGRPRVFQAITLLLALTIGIELLNKLPRMTDIGRAREDEAIMGRMLAWEKARLASKESATGEGFKNFKAMIEYDGEEIFKATHSSYVLVGAELGPVGMFFFLGVLYASLRILVTARCHRFEDESSRRAMFVLLLGFMASSWLIDRSYHLEYFLLAGAVAALHRRLGVEAGILDPEGETPESEYEESELDSELEDEAPPRRWVEEEPPEWSVFQGPELAYQVALPKAHGTAGSGVITGLEDVDTSSVAEAAIEEELTRRWFWRRLTIIDGLLIVLFTKIIFDIWDYLLRIYFI